MGRLFEDWGYEIWSGRYWEIRCNGADEPADRQLRMPDVFLSTADDDWLSVRSLPIEPLTAMEPERLGLKPALTSREIPVLFGLPTFQHLHDGCAQLGLDVLGSAFFMLSRYEELVLTDRDEFGRFPARASVAFRCNFLYRPIIDEYVEILWSAMRRLWPQLVRASRAFQLTPSHDVDRPARHAFHGLGTACRLSVGDALKRRKLLWAMEGPWQWMLGPRKMHPRDPFNTFEAIMDLSDSVGLKSTFYFFAGRTSAEFDAQYDLSDHSIGMLMARIHQRGHLLGLHGSYESFRCPDVLRAEADCFRARCRSLAIAQQRFGVRMHFLRWCVWKSWQSIVSAGLEYDATVGFADHPGFRCGTCHEYQAFDAAHQEALALTVRPLIAMDVSLTHSGYLHLRSYQEASKTLRRLRAACELVCGNFSLLWHNSELVTADQWRCYQGVLGSIK